MIAAPTLGAFGEEGEYCAGLFYELDSGLNPFGDCLTIEWEAVQVPGNGIVDPEDVIFTSPFGLTTFVSVPLTGLYCFAFVCGVEGNPI